MKRVVGWDTETHLIKQGMPAPSLVCLSTDETEEGCIYGGTEKGKLQAVDKIEEFLKDPHTISTLHNAPFDLGVACAERETLLPTVFEALEQGRIRDSINRQKIIDNAGGELKYEWDEVKEEWKKNPGYAMDTLLYKHFREYRAKGEDTWRLRYAELDGIPISKWPDDAIDYSIRDAHDAKRLHDYQEEVAVENGSDESVPGETDQNKAHWALHLMSMHGVRTDPVMVRKLKKEWERDLAEQVKIAQKFGFIRSEGKKAGTRNMKAIKEAVEEWYEDNNKKLKKTPKGAPSTDRETLTGTDNKGLLAVSESVRIGKLLTTYLPVVRAGQYLPINCSYNVIIETFRTSCRRPNWQNLPRKGNVRDCVIPRPGWVFVFCDYDTLEMLTLAQVCLDLFGYSMIAEAAKAGEDFHLAMAAEMNGMPYSQAKQLLDAGDTKIADDRQFCKIANYGFAGGMGPSTFIEYAKGYGVVVSRALAKRLHGLFRKKWTEMIQYFAYCGNQCNNEDGRAERVQFIRSGLFRGDVTYTAVCNGYFQHLAAMGAKQAVYQCAKECYVDSGSPLYGCRPWLFAHDEIGIEVPYISPQFAHNAAMRLQQLMVEEMKKWCPDVPIAASAAMTMRWLKGAKPVYNKNKQMVPAKKEGKKWVEDSSILMAA